MSSISVGELKAALENYPDDAEVLMHIHHKYTIDKESGIRGWDAYINAVGFDEKWKEVRLMN